MSADKSFRLSERVRLNLEDAVVKLELLMKEIATNVGLETVAEQLKDAQKNFEDAKIQVENATSSLEIGLKIMCARLEEETNGARIGVCQEQSKDSILRKKICEVENDKLMLKVAPKESRTKVQTLETKRFEQIINKQRQGDELKDRRVELGNPKVFLDIAIHGDPAGRIVMELFADTTPLIVENFRALCTGEKGVSQTGTPLHYKGTSFYFTSLGFVAGGNITGGNSGPGESIYRTLMPAENFIRKHTGPGDLTMIGNWQNSSTTHGSNFFISTAKNSRDDGQNVVIGKMIQGMDVLNAIVRAFPRQDFLSEGSLVIKDCGQLL